MDSLDTKDKINKCVNKNTELGQYFTERDIITPTKKKNETKIL